MSGFTDPDHNHFTPRIDHLLNQLNGSGKISAQTFPQSLELKNFYVQNTSGLFKVIHRSV